MYNEKNNFIIIKIGEFMKNLLKRVLLVSLLIASTSYAGSRNDIFESYSLVGFEGSIATLKGKDSTNAETEEDSNILGMKIGSETENVRMFLSIRNAFVKDFDSARMYGLELQYKFNFSSKANFFIGGNYGRITYTFEDESANDRKFSSKYLGGDIGININVDESFDLEFGGRLMTLDESSDTLGASTYTFDDISMGYISLIFKYQMD